jgi:hypothetical protein
MFASKDTLLTRPSGGYNIARSVRLRSSASASFSKATVGTATNKSKWTTSMWVKRGLLSSNYFAFMGKTISVSANFALYFNSSTDQVVWTFSNAYYMATNQVFRDPSAWYHFVFVWDSANATAALRARVYCNGSEITSWAVDNRANITTSMDCWNSNDLTYVHSIGTNGSLFYDGYMTEVNSIDGQTLTPSSFGTTNTTTGVWQPIKYTGTYGNDGFYLNFSDNSTSATLGTDFSGNSNTWTVNNISVTAGSTYDSMTDVPTLTSATAANFCTLNPLKTGTSYKPTISNANLQLASATATQNPASSTIGAFTGKWYFEAVVTNLAYLPGIGVCDPSVSFGTGDDWRTYAKGVTLYSNGTLFTNSSSSSTAYVYLVNDVIGVAFDADTGKVWIAKNNTWFNSGSPSAGTGQVATATGYASLAPVFDGTTVGTNDTIVCNFGQRPFSYTPPTGFVALNTYNLPTSTITNGAAYMAATLYTGNNPSTQSVNNAVNGISFQPDLVWIKSRSAAYYNTLYDSVRGSGATKSIYSNTSDAEGTFSTLTNLSSFNSNGFTVGTTSSSPNTLNESGATFVGWQWKKGASSGFDIVSQTLATTGINTITHSLNAVPTMVLAKKTSGSEQWLVYQSSATTQSQYLGLNTTAAVATSGNLWGSSAFTSSQIYFTGTSGNSYVFYIFAPVAGYSAFGSYTGNGSADGPFIYTGFRPRWVLWKKSNTSGGHWGIIDSGRNTYNLANLSLLADAADGDATNVQVMDFVSNGFKIRTSDAGENSSGDTFIYAAFAENPFRNALAR